MPDENGITRRMRNERVGEITPSLSIPYAGEHLWDIFHTLNRCVHRVIEGYYRLIPPTEYEAWFRLTRTLVYPTEYDILCSMDRIYCEEANKELEDLRSRREDEQRREMNDSFKKRGG